MIYIPPQHIFVYFSYSTDECIWNDHIVSSATSCWEFSVEIVDEISHTIHVNPDI